MADYSEIDGYQHETDHASHMHATIMPPIERELAAHFAARPGAARRVFDLGCGNGSTAAHLAALGYDMTGIDPSADGIERARRVHPGLSIDQGSAYDDLAGRYGRFPAAISLEVVEHLYNPRAFARTLFDLIEPGGLALVSTPYHGYLKNLAIALFDKSDSHWSPLWDHGHIKFWSRPTLTVLLEEAGFRDIRFHRVGRIPALAMSMIAVARRP